MSGQGYPECHLKDWPMTSPGAPTDSNLLAYWLWIQSKPWCTGKQLPLGFNPMDLLITDSNLLVSRLEVNRGRYEEGPTNYYD